MGGKFPQEEGISKDITLPPFSLPPSHFSGRVQSYLLLNHLSLPCSKYVDLHLFDSAPCVSGRALFFIPSFSITSFPSFPRFFPSFLLKYQTHFPHCPHPTHPIHTLHTTALNSPVQGPICPCMSVCAEVNTGPAYL